MVTGSTVTAHATFPVIADPTWCLLTVGDTNGDGVDDLLWFHGESRRVVVWEMTVNAQHLLQIDRAFFITDGVLPAAPDGFRWSVRISLHPTLRLLWQLESVQ